MIEVIPALEFVTAIRRALPEATVVSISNRIGINESNIRKKYEQEYVSFDLADRWLTKLDLIHLLDDLPVLQIEKKRRSIKTLDEAREDYKKKRSGIAKWRVRALEAEARVKELEQELATYQLK